MTQKTILFFSILLFLVSCNSNKNHNQIKKIAELNQDSIIIDSLMNSNVMKFELALSLELKDFNKAKAKYLEIINTDSTNYWAIQAKNRIRYLNANTVKKEFIKKISGTWDWTWKGTNWGDIETPTNRKIKRKLIIKENGEIEFYENGKLTMSDTYDIKSPNEYPMGEYLIELKSNKIIYSLWYNKTRLQLSEPNCECGCVTNEYFRKWKSGI